MSRLTTTPIAALLAGVTTATALCAAPARLDAAERPATPPAAIARAGASAVSMPSSWTTFRLNSQLNPVISAAITPSWTLETAGPISASPTVVDGTLYLGNNHGSLFAIDVVTGSVRWTYRARNPLMSAPLVHRGVVIVGEGNENSTTYVPRRQVQVGNGPNGLIGIDAATGRQRWYVPLGGSAMPTPAIVDGTLVHHNGAGGIIALDPLTGRVLYRQVPKSIASMAGALPIGDGIIVTAGIYPNRIFAFRAADGREVWSYPLSEYDSGIGDCPPVTDGTRVFGNYIAPPQPNRETGVGVPGQQRVYALEARTGRPLWNVGLETGIVPPRNEAAIPLVVGDRLYLGSAVAPYVHALDARTGRVVWRAKVAGPVKGGIVAADGIVYFGDLGGNLWALDAQTGKVVGVKHAGTPFNVGSPIIVGQSLIIGSKTGRIAAVPLASIRGSRDASVAESRGRNGGAAT